MILHIQRGVFIPGSCVYIYTRIYIYPLFFFWNWIGNSSSLAFHSSISGWKFSTFLPHQIDLSTQGKYQKGDNKKTGHRQNYRVIILEKGVILERFFFSPNITREFRFVNSGRLPRWERWKDFFPHSDALHLLFRAMKSRSCSGLQIISSQLRRNPAFMEICAPGFEEIRLWFLWGLMKGDKLEINNLLRYESNNP